VSIAIGVGLFGDHVQTAGGRLIGEILAMMVLFAGVFSLTRSPLVVHVKSENGDDAQILGGSRRRGGPGPALEAG